MITSLIHSKKWSKEENCLEFLPFPLFQSHFTEYRIRELLESTLNLFTYFEKEKLFHSYLHLGSIFLDECGKIKVHDNQVFKEKFNFFEAGINERPPFCFNSIQMEEFSKGYNSYGSLNKGEIFSLGITLLSVATLKDSDPLFDLKKFAVNFDVIKNRLNEVRDRYSNLIFTLISVMCLGSESDELTFQELYDYFKEKKDLPFEEKSFKDLEDKDFSIQSKEKSSSKRSSINSRRSISKNRLNSSISLNDTLVPAKRKFSKRKVYELPEKINFPKRHGDQEFMRDKFVFPEIYDTSISPSASFKSNLLTPKSSINFPVSRISRTSRSSLNRSPINPDRKDSSRSRSSYHNLNMMFQEKYHLGIPKCSIDIYTPKLSEPSVHHYRSPYYQNSNSSFHLNSSRDPNSCNSIQKSKEKQNFRKNSRQINGTTKPFWNE